MIRACIILLLACQSVFSAINGTSLCWNAVSGSNLVYRVWRVGYYGIILSNNVQIVQEGTNLCYNFGSPWPPKKFYLTTYDTWNAAESDRTSFYYTAFLHLDIPVWQSGWIEFSYEPSFQWWPYQPVYFGGSFNFPVDPEMVRMFYRFRPET